MTDPTPFDRVIEATAAICRVSPIALRNSNRKQAGLVSARQIAAVLAKSWGSVTVADIAAGFRMTPDEARGLIHMGANLLARDDGARAKADATRAALGPPIQTDRATVWVASHPLNSTTVAGRSGVTLRREPWGTYA